MSASGDMDPKDEPKPTLTPPASEEADKHDDSGSELSELELEPDESAEIVPDHYYDGGRVPVFKPVSTHEIDGGQSTPWQTLGQHGMIKRTESMLISIGNRLDYGSVSQLQVIRSED